MIKNVKPICLILALFFVFFSENLNAQLPKKIYFSNPEKYIITLEIQDIGTFYIDSGELNLGEMEIINFFDKNDIIPRKRPGQLKRQEFILYISNRKYKTIEKWKSVLKELNRWFEKSKTGKVQREEFILTMKDKKNGKTIFKIKGVKSWPYRLSLHSSSLSLPTVVLYMTAEQIKLSF